VRYSETIISLLFLRVGYFFIFINYSVDLSCCYEEHGYASARRCNFTSTLAPLPRTTPEQQKSPKPTIKSSDVITHPPNPSPIKLERSLETPLFLVTCLRRRLLRLQYSRYGRSMILLKWALITKMCPKWKSSRQ
jgi:hypothetical protein